MPSQLTLTLASFVGAVEQIAIAVLQRRPGRPDGARDRGVLEVVVHELDGEVAALVASLLGDDGASDERDGGD